MTTTVALSFDDALARVQVECTGMPTTIDTALVERSTDGVRWTTVRGAAEWPCSGGAFVRTLDDYEFTPGVANTYRVRGVDSAGPVFVASGGSVNADATNLSPGLPPGIVEGDTVLLMAETRNSGTGTVDLPANWTSLVNFGNMRIMGRRYDGAWTMPSVAFTADASGDTNIAGSAAFRNVGLSLHNSATLLNGSAQNIATPALSISEDGCAVIVAAWKQDDFTTMSTLAFFTEIDKNSATAGNDASHVWDYAIQGTGGDIGATSFTVTGGAAAISRSIALALSALDFLVEDTADITPVLDSHWLKSIARPFLNMAVSLGAPRDRQYAARQTLLDVVDRSDPLAITGRRASASFDLTVRTRDDAETQRLRSLLAGGDTLLLQAPPGSRYQTCYVTVSDVSEGLHGSVNPLARWTLPCTTTARPEADVVGVTSTCDTILSDFATCADVLAEFADCVAVMEYVAIPEDVIVP